MLSYFSMFDSVGGGNGVLGSAGVGSDPALQVGVDAVLR